MTKDDELAAAQAAVDRVHARIEDLRALALARTSEAEADHSGSTYQETYQRDVLAHHHASQAQRLWFGDLEQVVFGQLDISDGDTWRIGRVSVIDEQGDVILVDWRADAAEPFYRATGSAPMGVARRRRYVARGPVVRDLDDELLDVPAADALGLVAVSGQGALMASLERTRSRHMRDIVVTIQADQDRIIRSTAGGTLIVSGGPGTGKTVVALHRVAYLLYSQRERMGGRGVLVVGPSKAFSTYVEKVLPALGEDRAVLRSLDAFVPHGVEVVGWDTPAVAAVSGSAIMATVLRRLLGASLPALPPSTFIVCDDVSVEVPGRTLADVRKRLVKKVAIASEGRRYHDRAATADEAMRAALWTAWSRAAKQAWGRMPDRREVGFDDALDGSPQHELLRRCFWPPLSPVDVLGTLVDGQVRLGSIAGDLLSPDERSLLERAWSDRAHPTGDDVALLDELDALLGPSPAERRRAARNRGETDVGIRLSVDRAAGDTARGEPGAAVGGHRYDGYAHVVVDEAQDLSPMQWRMVARRGAYASWTVVGDLAQRARTAEPKTWDDVAALIGRRQVTEHRLTVNYRTPEEVVALARAVLVVAGEDPDLAPTSVRVAGRRPLLVRASDVHAAAVEAADAALARTEGTVAVIAEGARVPAVAAALADRPDRLTVLDPRTAKGLEHDEVVIVAPDEIVASSDVGGHALYVAVTRTTTGLTLVAAPAADVPGAHLCDVESR